MADTIEIASRFNGPLTSGNGGYSAGVFTRSLTEPVEVTLRSPVPLDTPLGVETVGDGSLEVRDGETLIAEAREVAGVEVEVPAPVSVAHAREATRNYRGEREGPFCRCFVCGLARDDALGVFAGEVPGREVVASPWTPAPWTADEGGAVRPEFVWAVLDCPNYFAAYMRDDLAPSVLGRMTVAVIGDVAAGAEHVVIAWPIESDGRKRHAGSAVISAEGDVLAVARALNIELRAA